MRIRHVSYLVLVTIVVVGARTGGAAPPRFDFVVQAGTGTAAETQAAAGRLAAAPDQVLTDEGVTLRYREFGTGDPVVLIHGYSTALESMTPLAEVLAPSHRVVAFDVRGFGRSSKFADPARFGQLMVDDVVRVLDHLRIDKAHLVGHSMGGLIAANVASRYPRRVVSATLIAAPFYADKPTFTREVTPWLADLESGKGLANFIQWLFPGMEAKMAASFSAQSLQRNDLPSLIAVMRSLPDLTVAGVRAPGVPLLVTVGTNDPLRALSSAFATASSGARLLEIEGADHINVAQSPDMLQAMRGLIAGRSKARDLEAYPSTTRTTCSEPSRTTGTSRPVTSAPSSSTRVTPRLTCRGFSTVMR